MPFLHPYQPPKKKKEFTFRECQKSGLRQWQCPPLQFSILAAILLVATFVMASKVVLNQVTAIVILVVFAGVVVLIAWRIVRNYNKALDKTIEKSLDGCTDWSDTKK